MFLGRGLLGALRMVFQWSHCEPLIGIPFCLCAFPLEKLLAGDLRLMHRSVFFMVMSLP